MTNLDQLSTLLKEKAPFVPKAGLILGSGLGGFDKSMDIEAIVDYKDLPGFPVSSAPGHKGRFLFGRVSGVPIVAMQGRVHMYEGYSPQEVVLPIRLMSRIGAEILIVTNAAGGLGDGFKQGDLMIITDQITSFVPSPLMGPNDPSLGVRFPDMTQVYDLELTQFLRDSAKDAGIVPVEGVYLQFTGPQYETPTEVRMAKLLGAHAVGMSTAVEALAARHAGMRVCGVSLISNLAAGLQGAPLTEEEVLETGQQTAQKFAQLITGLISRLQ